MIDSRRPNLSFAPSDNNSPNKKLPSPSPSDTFNTNAKKSVFGFWNSNKKKGNGTGGSEAFQQQPSKADEGKVGGQKSKGKLKMTNKKNIADGKIRLNVIDNDRVPEDYLIEYKDNPFEILDHNPTRTTSYIENLRSRDFSQINNREVKRFVEAQQNTKDVAPPLAVENLELDLLELTDSIDRLFGKFYRFFQGLLPGFCIIHLFLIFNGTDDLTVLNSYVPGCLRMYQLFYIIAIISTLGAFHRLIETRSRYYEALHSQPYLKDSLNSQFWKYFIASKCFGIVYALIVVNNEFVSILSNSAGGLTMTNGTVTSSYTNDNGVPISVNLSFILLVFRVLSVITTFLSVIGWFSLILAFEEISKPQTGITRYNDDDDVTRTGYLDESP